MGKNTFRLFFKLVRFDYSFFSALGVFLSGFLAGDLQGFQAEYVIAFLIVLFSAMGSFSLNDYFDYEIDKKNKRPDRPLTLDVLNKKIVLVTVIIELFLAVLLSFFLNIIATSLVLVSLSFFILYSLELKKIFLLKNIIIAFAFVATILLGSIVSDVTIEPLIIFFAAMGFIVGFAIEIMLDIADVKGDKEQKISTIASKFGKKIAAWISIILYFSIIVLDPLPFFIMIDSRLNNDPVFVLLILIPIVSYIFVIKSLKQDVSKKNIFKLKKQLFLTMQIGSIAYLLGVLF